MNTLYVLGRCLTCWHGEFAQVPVVRHLPAAFNTFCTVCAKERQFAVTGQVISTLSAASLRQIRSAQEKKVRVDWSQLPLVPAILPTDAKPPAPGEPSKYHRPSRSTDSGSPAKGKP